MRLDSTSAAIRKTSQSEFLNIGIQGLTSSVVILWRKYVMVCLLT